MKATATEVAALTGKGKILRWALGNHGTTLTPEVFSAAISSGNLKMAKWLRERGCPWSEEAFFVAAEKGKREILDWLLRHGCPWNSEIYLHAQNIRVLEWLRKNNCPWTSFLSQRFGDRWEWEVIKWAVEVGFRVEKEVVVRMMREAGIKLARWAYERLQEDVYGEGEEEEDFDSEEEEEEDFGSEGYYSEGKEYYSEGEEVKDFNSDTEEEDFDSEEEL